jgi:hypothetical protein
MELGTFEHNCDGEDEHKRRQSKLDAVTRIEQIRDSCSVHRKTGNIARDAGYLLLDVPARQR